MPASQHVNAVYKLMMVSLISALLTGCGLHNDNTHPEPPVNLQTIDILLENDANLDSATSIDVVLVHKPELLQTLMKMSARTYYDQVDQLRRDYPKMITVSHWELTPGQAIRDYDVCSCDNVIGAIAFVNYLTPGDHRIRIGEAEHIHLRLKKYDFCIEEQGCDSQGLPLKTVKQNQLASSPVAKPLQPTMLMGNSEPQSYNTTRPTYQPNSTNNSNYNNTLPSPDAGIRSIHNNVSQVRKTLDATKALIKELPF